ncbi:APC family permease [Leekyejoonella antrihumi]|uniref:APC family permease n=1 Tax=Leekyejoonella antrihumi TaxID=1660198 RepID=A0A563E0X3_9MICO|nr:APC family permease [Leekyejoonella antrihumi]TWP35544.1 APC family permease [Leekyejoonella antrihumi]
MDSSTTRARDVAGEDAKLRKSLGYWSLLAMGVGSVIGSGWLFSAMYAAQTAGPASLIAWVIGGALMLMIALVFAELGMVRPESGGLVRYPLYSNGKLAATVVGLAMWLSYVGNPPSEASGVVQYASAWLGGVYDTKAEKLTHWGILLAIVLMAGFVVLNYFGVRLFAESNNIVTAIKIIIPTITVILLIVSGFDHQHGAGGSANFTGHGGFAPEGYGAALGAIASAGMIFAYTGFRNIIELSGEAKNPRKDIPRALVTTIVFTILLYIALQIAFLAATPADLLAKSGWSGINFDSPYADLAKLLGFSWLYWLLIADSSLSPSGSGIVYTASNGRNVFGLAKNGLFPTAVMKIHQGSGIPRRALLLNFVVGICFLLPLPSWHEIVGVMSTMAAFTFSIGSITLLTFRAVGLGSERTRLKGMEIIAPLAFIVSSLVIFWSTWPDLKKTIPVVVIAVVWYAVLHIRGNLGMDEIRGGGWLVVYLAAMYVMSYIGSFGGQDWITAPWDTIVAAAIAIGCYVWGLREGVTYMTAHPEIVESLQAHAGDEEAPEVSVA